MSAVPLSATIITLNEEDTIQRALQSLQWVQEIIVVDSGSQDNTRSVAAANKAQVLHQDWLGYGQQKNFAQSKTSHDWVLNIDADEMVPPELAQWIQTKLSEFDTQVKSKPESTPVGIAFPRKTFFMGQWIQHGGWYPNTVVRLTHKAYGKWTEPSVHEKLQVKGKIIQAPYPLHHYTFKNLQDQIQTNVIYSYRGYEQLQKNGKTKSLIKLIFKPIGKFMELYFLKRGFLDGYAGFIIAVNAAHSMFLKYAYFYDTSQETSK